MNSKHKLREQRDNQLLTQRGLSEIAGVSPSTISHIECHRGPNVPAEQLRSTKTRYSTALKLAVGLSKLPPGEYSFEDFVASVDGLFTENELYEALANQLERQQRRDERKRKRKQQDSASEPPRLHLVA